MLLVNLCRPAALSCSIRDMPRVLLERTFLRLFPCPRSCNARIPLETECYRHHVPIDEAKMPYKSCGMTCFRGRTASP